MRNARNRCIQFGLVGRLDSHNAARIHIRIQDEAQHVICGLRQTPAIAKNRTQCLSRDTGHIIADVILCNREASRRARAAGLQDRRDRARIKKDLKIGLDRHGPKGSQSRLVHLCRHATCQRIDAQGCTGSQIRFGWTEQRRQPRIDILHGLGRGNQPALIGRLHNNGPARAFDCTARDNNGDIAIHHVDRRRRFEVERRTGELHLVSAHKCRRRPIGRRT